MIPLVCTTTSEIPTIPTIWSVASPPVNNIFILSKIDNINAPVAFPPYIILLNIVSFTGSTNCSPTVEIKTKYTNITSRSHKKKTDENGDRS